MSSLNKAGAEPQKVKFAVFREARPVFHVLCYESAWACDKTLREGGSSQPEDQFLPGRFQHVLTSVAECPLDESRALGIVDRGVIDCSTMALGEDVGLRDSRAVPQIAEADQSMLEPTQASE